MTDGQPSLLDIRDLRISFTQDGRAITQVRVESEGLTDPRHEALTRSGSPVQAVMSLRDDGILAGPTDALLQFLVKVGLR